MKLTLYLDTSIPSAYYDELKPERQKVTQGWWDNDLKNYEEGVISTITIDELQATADESVRNKLIALVMGLKTLAITRETTELARQYVDNGVFPEEEFKDALHLAVATVNGIDLLASWNFEHMVNLDTKHKANAVNVLNGYQTIEIESPLELGGGKYV